MSATLVRVAWVEHIDAKPVSFGADVTCSESGRFLVVLRTRASRQLPDLDLPAALQQSLCDDAIKLAKLRLSTKRQLGRLRALAEAGEVAH